MSDGVGSLVCGLVLLGALYVGCYVAGTLGIPGDWGIGVASVIAFLIFMGFQDWADRYDL